MTCDRCKKESISSIGSMFNTEQICFECKDAEMAHPAYKDACDAEMNAVLNGDYDFAGVGLPDELSRPLGN